MSTLYRTATIETRNGRHVHLSVDRRDEFYIEVDLPSGERGEGNILQFDREEFGRIVNDVLAEPRMESAASRMAG